MRPRQSPPYDLVVFDCDSTLSTLEGIDELGHGVPGVAELTERAMAGEIPLERVYEERLERIAPTRAQVDAIGERYVETLVPGARELIAGLLALGKRVVIVSGGLRQAILPLADHLGIERSDVHAVELEFDGADRYAGLAPEAPLARAGGKPRVVEPLAEGLRAALVGDGATDLEAKSAVDRFVAYAGVERRDAVLAEADARLEALDLLGAAPLLLTGAELDELAERGMAGFQRERGTHRAAPTDGRGLWIPGPVFVRPEIRAVLGRPAEGHRTAAIEEAIASLDEPLRGLFGADPDHHSVGVHSVTATGLMEMGLRATGPRVLSLVNGSFSERFADIAESLGKEVTVLRSELGAGPDLEGARALLTGDGAPFDAVTVCASETSTGAYVSTAEIGAALAGRRGALLFVDAVTLLGAGPVDATGAGLDFVLAGTQKALALPPGLGLYAASTALLEAAAARPSGSWFLDLHRVHQAHARRKPPMTPTVPLLRALEAQLAAIASGALEDGLEREAGGATGAGGPRTESCPYARRFARHSELARRTREALAELGVRPFGSTPGSPTVTCFDFAGAGLDAGRIRALCAERGYTVARGYGSLGDSCLRIGHMGDRSIEELDGLLVVLTHAIRSTLGAQP